MHSHSKLARSSLAKPLAGSPLQELSWANTSDQRVYQKLQESGPLTRDAIAEQTGIARTTVFDALTRLTIHGLVTHYKEPRETRGRRRVYFAAIAVSLPREL
ncbi:MAG: helix-turn-helix domain-containing protein [Candidatus Heimdallarchaeota archaeon]